MKSNLPHCLRKMASFAALAGDLVDIRLALGKSGSKVGDLESLAEIGLLLAEIEIQTSRIARDLQNHVAEDLCLLS